MTTMLSFRTEEPLAAALDAEAARAGVGRSELLNQALRELLYRLRCERDAEVYAKQPLTSVETTGWATEAWVDDEAGTDWAEVFGG